MAVVISLITSAIGAHFGHIDFFALYTCVSIALSLYEDLTNAKTANGR